MIRELRYALRALRRAPAFSLTTILILTLAVGANGAILSMLYGLALRPLRVPAAHELVQVSTRDALNRRGDLTWGQFHELMKRQQVFSTVIGSSLESVETVESNRGILQASVGAVSGNYFSELGATPSLGRLIQHSDLDLGSVSGERVAVLGWGFWQRHFGGDPSVVGQTLKAGGVPLRIIGVAPRDFLGLGITIEHDVTLPLTIYPSVLASEISMIHGTSRWVAVTGRLKAGESIESARAQILTIWPSIVQAATPPSLEPSRRERYFDTVANVESGARGLERGFGLRNRYARPLYTLLGIAALILLIAAVNLGSLVFVRLDSSRHELAVRTAIGAGRARLVREVTLQGALLGGAGAAGGLFFAAQASPALAAFLTRDFLVPTALDVSVGWLVIIAAGVGSVGTGTSITAIAAWASTSPRLITTLAGGNRSVTRSARVGRVLVGVQAALVIVLLTHAALLGRNIYNMSAAESGLTSETVLVGRPLPRVGMYQQLDAAAYYRDALARLRAVPGVAAAAFSEYRPQQGALYPERVNRAGTPNDGTDVMAETTLVSPGLFETLGMSVIRGRDFALSDNEGSRRVVIISQSLAMRLFGDSGGLGERIRIASRPETQNLEVVGIVSNARLFDVRKGNLAIAYLPALQMGGLAHFKVLLARAPESAARAIQHAIDSLGAETLPRVQTVEYARGRTLLQERMMAALGGYFGVLALLLMAAGMYGLLAYVLSLRRKEMGIRMALGADGRQLGRTMLGDGLRIGGIGLLCGLVAALSTVGVLERVLVATSPYDPMAIAVACTALLIVTAVAAIIPAARASRVEPLDELRRE